MPVRPMPSTRRTLDTAIEATTLASWTRLGIAIRRRLWHWPPTPVPPGSMAGAHVLVTGGTRGIGKAAATALAAAGAVVGIVGRDGVRAQEAAAEIRRSAHCPDAAVWSDAADLGSLADVCALAARVRARTGRLAALVHAAGVLSHSYETSPEGTERTVAVHVVGTHHLTALMAPLLTAGAPSVVVWVSSGGMYLQRLDVEHLEPGPQEFAGARAYARAKRAQVALARQWALRLCPSGIACVAMHPGWVDTAALHEGLPRFAGALAPVLRSPAEGADTVVWLASGAAGPCPAPAFWLDRRARGEHRLPGTASAPAEEDRLWEWCEEKVAAARVGCAR